MVNKRVRNAVLGCNLKNDRMISVRFQGKPFNITVIQVYGPTSKAEEAEVERFYEDLQDLLELTPRKDVLFIIGDWNAKVGSQETPGVTGKFGLGIWNEAGQRLIQFCKENALVITNTLFQQHKRRLYTWTSPDGQHRNQTDYILCSQRWRSSIQSAKTRPGADYDSDHEQLIARKDSSGNHFAFLDFFSLGMILITASCTVLQTSIHSSSGTLLLLSCFSHVRLCVTP